MAEGWMKYWGQSRTSQETLDEYWEALMKRSDFCQQEEMKYFLHCTTLTGKERIQREGKLIGGYTGLPARAPLASHQELRGCWLAMSPKELPTRSPYGTQRVVIKAKTLLEFMSSPLPPDGYMSNDDKFDAPSSDEDSARAGNKRGKGKGKKKKQRPGNKNQKECYTKTKSKVPEKPNWVTPLLFFECAHYYGTNQYVRLLLVRADDADAEWCQVTLKEVDIRNNPFFEMKWGRIFTYTSTGGKREMIVEILVVGDIFLNTLKERPVWDVVGTAPRAGFDPRLGVLNQTT